MKLYLSFFSVSFFVLFISKLVIFENNLDMYLQIFIYCLLESFLFFVVFIFIYFLLLSVQSIFDFSLRRSVQFSIGFFSFGLLKFLHGVVLDYSDNFTFSLGGKVLVEHGQLTHEGWLFEFKKLGEFMFVAVAVAVLVVFLEKYWLGERGK